MDTPPIIKSINSTTKNLIFITKKLDFSYNTTRNPIFIYKNIGFLVEFFRESIISDISLKK